MGSLTPGPEDTKKQDYGSRCLAGATHSLKTIRADMLAMSKTPPRSARAMASRIATERPARLAGVLMLPRQAPQARRDNPERSSSAAVARPSKWRELRRQVAADLAGAGHEPEAVASAVHLRGRGRGRGVASPSR